MNFGFIIINSSNRQTHPVTANTAFRQTGLSCILQHFCWLKRQCADKVRLRCDSMNDRYSGFRRYQALAVTAKVERDTKT